LPEIFFGGGGIFSFEKNKWVMIDCKNIGDEKKKKKRQRLQFSAFLHLFFYKQKKEEKKKKSFWDLPRWAEHEATREEKGGNL
jgi:hypothetical protein